MDEIDIIKKVFAMRKIAVVGMSPKEYRPSNYVAKYMVDKGGKCSLWRVFSFHS